VIFYVKAACMNPQFRLAVLSLFGLVLAANGQSSSVRRGVEAVRVALAGWVVGEEVGGDTGVC
jgi:hypothetical protein